MLRHIIRGSCQELLQKDLERCHSVQEISLSGLTGSFVFLQGRQPRLSGHHQWKFCLASLSSYLFLRPRGRDTAVCSVELGVSPEPVRQCQGGSVVVASRGVFPTYIFRIVFSSALPRGRTRSAVSV